MGPALNQISNEELLHRYQSADAEAFEEFFGRNQKLVFQYLYSRLGSVQETEDAFQKTFFKVHRYILKYDRNQSALGWVFTIARNVAIDCYSQRVSVCELGEEETDANTVNSAERLEARDTLTKLLDDLPPVERRLIERRFLTEDSFAHIGRDEGWTADNTRQKTSRLLRNLRSRLIQFSRESAFPNN